MIIDLAKNPKQEAFFNMAIESAYGLNEYRNLFYGGAIRGGKTFVSLAVLSLLAKNFKGSKWHVIRSDFPALQGTAIPSLEKILRGSQNWGWNRDKSNFFAYHKKSDGKIFFKGENIARDPELNDFLGLETNGFLFEQIEEISEKTYEIGSSRVGSWYIDPMPKPLMLSTFNPTQTWIKKRIYEKWRKGELVAPDFFQMALPNDNAFVTQEQWNSWGRLAERYQKQFIEGDWSDFTDKNSIWAFAYIPSKHDGEPELDRNYEVRLSFDFNKNPITCSVVQEIDGEDRFLETIKLANSDIYALCDYIKVYYPNCLFIVTGDASGNNGSALVRDNINFYKVIKTELNISSNQIRVPSVNPRMVDNQVLFNSVLAHKKVVFHKIKCEHLIYDMQNVKMLPDGTLKKVDRTDPTQQADALDTARYYFNTFHHNYLKQAR